MTASLTVRDPTTCARTGGSLSLRLTGPSDALSLALDASNGSLKIDNTLATSFQGTLDDANHDGRWLTASPSP